MVCLFVVISVVVWLGRGAFCWYCSLGLIGRRGHLGMGPGGSSDDK
jgi:hypothetical protein